MKLSALLLVATSFTAMAASEDQFSKHLAAQPSGQLVVEIDFGSIAVTTNHSNEVTVEVKRKVRLDSKEAEEKFLREAPIEVTQEGNKVFVRCHTKNKIGNLGWSLWKGASLQAEYTLSVPAQFNARMMTAGGAIKVQSVSGEVNAQTSGGSLEFSDVRGPVEGNTSGGSIRALGCVGTTKLHTSGGSIRIIGGGGSVNGQTSGGSITVQHYNGPATVHTSGGSVTVENVAGAIEGDTSGGGIHAVLLAPLPGSVRLGTSGGSVTVATPETAAFNLDAETSVGRVSNELPMTSVDTKEKNHLQGAVNGGGQTVRLRTSGGSIHIKKL